MHVQKNILSFIFLSFKFHIVACNRIWTCGVLMENRLWVCCFRPLSHACIFSNQVFIFPALKERINLLVFLLSLKRSFRHFHFSVWKFFLFLWRPSSSLACEPLRKEKGRKSKKIPLVPYVQTQKKKKKNSRFFQKKSWRKRNLKKFVKFLKFFEFLDTMRVSFSYRKS